MKHQAKNTQGEAEV